LSESTPSWCAFGCFLVAENRVEARQFGNIALQKVQFLTKIALLKVQFLIIFALLGVQY
jgi:hypothetical protein